VVVRAGYASVIYLNEVQLTLLETLRQFVRAYLGRSDTRGYKPLRYRESGTPEENTERLKESVAEGFELIRNRTDEQNLFVGRFFGIVLLIERKLVQLLLRFDPQIEEKTLGGKLTVFKDFLNDLHDRHSNDDIDTADYRYLLGPLNEIKKIRDAMAHNLSKNNFSLSEIRQSLAYVKKKRPDLYDGAVSASKEADQCLALIAAFGFVFSVDVAFVDHLFE
jgi:hypothetical protein